MKKPKPRSYGKALFIVISIIVVAVLAFYGAKWVAPEAVAPAPEPTPVVVEKKVSLKKRIITPAIAPKVVPTCTPETAPNITLVTPNGGEIYTTGQQITVKWKSCNAPVDSKVMITLKSSQSTFGAEISTVKDSGYTVITIPTALGGGQASVVSGKYYKISVQLGGNAMGSGAPTDDSDGLFSINAVVVPELSLADAKKLAVQKWNTYQNCTQYNNTSECKESIVGIQKSGSEYIVYEDSRQLDDSVSTVRRRATAVYINGSWSLSAELPKQISCAAGRGHADFSTEPCE